MYFGPILLGRLFDTIGRRIMIASTYALSGILLAVTASLFSQNLLSAQGLIGPCSYFRYVDDVILFCPGAKVPFFVREARRVFSTHQLETHPVGQLCKSKVGYLNKGFDSSVTNLSAIRSQSARRACTS